MYNAFTVNYTINFDIVWSIYNRFEVLANKNGQIKMIYWNIRKPNDELLNRNGIKTIKEKLFSYHFLLGFNEQLGY